MKSLDQRLSEVVSPFDDVDKDQSELSREQYIQYQKDSLIEAIGKIKGNQEFDLYFEDVISVLSLDDRIQFLTLCLQKLSEVYPLDVVIDYINTENILEIDSDQIISFIKFFVYDIWLDDIVPYIPTIEVKSFSKSKNILNKVKDTYLKTQEEIIKDVTIHPLIRYHFNYCTRSDGEKTILIWISKDTVGVISRQLVLNEVR